MYCVTAMKYKLITVEQPKISSCNCLLFKRFSDITLAMIKLAGLNLCEIVGIIQILFSFKN